jgi:hypothetical protein
MTFNLYWGDLHSHCSVSYGGGTVEQALARARGQLDFCSITGHAFWPDMPADRERYGPIIDYHNEGFARLARNWPSLLEKLAAATEPGRFVAFPSYEWHSLEYGDHNVYARGPELELRDAPDLPALQEIARRSGAIVIPHHIGYAAGYRGLDWRHFREDVSPFAEIFSLHGCSESDDAPYPYLHDMGPRDAGSTAEAGWAAGRRFGIIASTDHHGGYPGSHGDGRVAVLARELTREAIWGALRERRVYAVTGDKIDARFFVNDAWIGSEIAAPGTRHLRVTVAGSDALDRVEVLKNGRVIRRFFASVGQASRLPNVARSLRDRNVASRSDVAALAGQASDLSAQAGRLCYDALRHRLRITWGWGRKDEAVRWNCRLTLSEGTITRIEPCFAGHSVIAPKGVGGHDEMPDEEDLPHEILERGDRHCAWRSVSIGNLSTRHPTTQALSLEIEAPPSARIDVEANGRRYTHPLGELIGTGRSHYLRGWLSEAIRIGPAVPLADCRVDEQFDDEPEQPVDVYRVRAAQKNGQWVWLTPIWVQR